MRHQKGFVEGLYLIDRKNQCAQKPSSCINIGTTSLRVTHWSLITGREGDYKMGGAEVLLL